MSHGRRDGGRKKMGHGSLPSSGRDEPSAGGALRRPLSLDEMRQGGAGYLDSDKGPRTFTRRKFKASSQSQRYTLRAQRLTRCPPARYILYAGSPRTVTRQIVGGPIRPVAAMREVDLLLDRDEDQGRSLRS